MPPPAVLRRGRVAKKNSLLPEEQENGYNKSMKINKLFWFRRPDGFVIQFTEQDAWQPYAEYEPRWKLMGVSDGTIYKKMTVDARKALNEVSLRMAQYTRNKQEVPPSLSKQVEKANLDFNKANQAAMAAEMEQMAKSMQPKGQPGSPGGAGPGVAGSPRPGAQPAGPRLIKQAPGAINQDRMAAAGSVSMPRKM